MVPTPDQIAAFRDLGAYALFVVAIVGFFTGLVRVGRLVDAAANKVDEAHARELAELTRDRDEWKALAQTTVARLDRVGDLLEDHLGKKVR